MEDHHSLWWEEMELEMPDGLPEKVYLRFAVYESPTWQRGGRPRLVGVDGTTMQHLRQMTDPRGRGRPLQLSAPPTNNLQEPPLRGGRGTLWIERCQLVVLDD